VLLVTILREEENDTVSTHKEGKTHDTRRTISANRPNRSSKPPKATEYDEICPSPPQSVSPSSRQQMEERTNHCKSTFKMSKST
jgi:hypothetical protein